MHDLMTELAEGSAAAPPERRPYLCQSCSSSWGDPVAGLVPEHPPAESLGSPRARLLPPLAVHGMAPGATSFISPFAHITL